MNNCKPAKQVIRIEHYSCKTGFWNCKYKMVPKSKSSKRPRDYHSKYNQIRERQASYNGFPNLYGDDDLYEQVHGVDTEPYKFAFHTVEQLQRGFTEEGLCECIKVLGFRVLRLTVTDYYESQYQVLFKDPIKIEDISSQFCDYGSEL